MQDFAPAKHNRRSFHWWVPPLWVKIGFLKQHGWLQLAKSYRFPMPLLFCCISFYPCWLNGSADSSVCLWVDLLEGLLGNLHRHSWYKNGKLYWLWWSLGMRLKCGEWNDSITVGLILIKLGTDVYVRFRRDCNNSTDLLTFPLETSSAQILIWSIGHLLNSYSETQTGGGIIPE